MRRALATASLVAGLILVPASAASAKTFHPTRTDDPAPNGCKKRDCSLREAVIAINALDPEQRFSSAIVLRPGKHYKLTRKGAGEDAALTGDLDVVGSVVFGDEAEATVGPVVRTQKGHGAKPGVIDGNDIDRILQGSLTLARVVLRDGHARVGTGDDGGGAAIEGNFVAIHKSSLVSNVAEGTGGAVHNELDLAIQKTKLKGNSAAGDGGAVYYNQADCDGPEGGATIDKSQATTNSAGGAGGAIFRGGCHLVDISRTTLGDNRANGPGGAISGGVDLFQSTVAGNVSRSYGGGLAGGGIVNRSTISGNSANTGGGIGTDVGTPGFSPGLQVQDSTIANNHADRDGGGISAFGDATVNLDFVTVARNIADEGLNGGSQGPGQGGGLFQEVGASVSVANTIVALNGLAENKGRDDCYTFAATGFDSLGHNLIGSTDDCAGFDAPGDLIGGALKLGKLADNGGPTRTIALKKGSRAIGHADPAAKPPNSGQRHLDQRGFKRDQKPDIGAFERNAKK